VTAASVVTAEERVAHRLALLSAASFVFALLAAAASCELGIGVGLSAAVAVVMSASFAAAAAASVVGGGLAPVAAATAAFSVVGAVELLVLFVAVGVFCSPVMS
jgi:hypothetical protein